MKIITLLLVTSFLLVIMGCSKSEQPNNNTPKMVWKVPLLDGKEAFSFSPVIYKDIVIYGSKYARLDRYEKPKVVAFNKATGAKAWEWTDSQSTSENLSALSEAYTYENTLVFTTGARVYAIDMNTGKSLWSTKEVEAGGYSIYGLGDKIYHVRNNFDKEKSVLCTASVLTGDWKPLYIVEQQDKIATFDHKMLIKNENGESHIYFTYFYTNLEYTKSDAYLVKMNVKTDSIIFNKFLPEANAYSIAGIDDIGIYLTGGALKVYNKYTGEFVKQYYLPPSNQKYGPGRYIVHGSKLFVPTSFPKFVCFDINSGSVLWTEDGVSTSLPSPLIPHNGVIYYTSASDGFLHAIDENGKRYWKFQSPDRKGSGNGIFDDPIAIDEKENRIYLSTFYSAVCYETIKK